MGWYWGILAGSAAASAAASSFDWIQTTTLSTTTNNVTFSNLNTYTDYRHLQFRINGRTATANSTNNTMTILVNGDTGANYSRHYLNAGGASITSTGTGSASDIAMLDVLPGSTATANVFGSFVMDVYDFRHTNKHKLLKMFYGALSSEQDTVFGGGLWRNTAAVTSIQFSGNFAAGSVFSVYGIKG